jgi:uncharacterized protein (DUF3084 family)
MEKTAVEFLLEKYIESGVITLDNINQALEMEKQQIIDAVQSYAPEWIDAEKYYQETFKK